jgi:predicted  nucleic acid-binding Zn-ribbon protein
MKEFQVRSQNLEKDREATDAATKVKAEADQRQQTLTTELALARQDLARQAGQLDGLSGENKAITQQLEDSKQRLTELHQSLGDARANLDRGGINNMVTAQATGGSECQRGTVRHIVDAEG